MTDQPYTPTTRGVRSAYLRVWNGQIQGANAVSVAAEFDRWLAEHDARIEAAAEQRGAEETLAYLIEDYPAYASHEEIRAWIQARLDHVRNADQTLGEQDDD